MLRQRQSWYPQVPERKSKNRRYRGAKFSEYRLKGLVTSFAKNMSIKDTADATRFSHPTVRNVFMRLRQHLFDYGFMRVQRAEGETQMPARAIFARTHRGVPEKFAHLFECEVLHRIYFTKNGRAVQRFAASKPDDMRKVRKFLNYNRLKPKYDIIELLGKKPDGSLVSRPFDPADYKSTSVVIVNERNIQPHDVFFRYLWKLLLKHPL